MKTSPGKNGWINWLPAVGFGSSLVAMVAVAASLYHSEGFAQLLNKTIGQAMTENMRLGVCLGCGLGAELVIAALFLPFFRSKKANEFPK